jgi:general secretion pathway protein M
MMERLARWLGALSERERRMVLLGGVAVVLIVILGGLLPLQRAASAAAQRVERKRNDLAFLRAVAPQLAGLAASAPPLRGSLVVVVDRSAREAGLGRALTGSEPSGDGALRVTLEQTSFDTLVNWLAQLAQRYGVSVDSAVIERGNTAGIVNATLVLRAAR